MESLRDSAWTFARETDAVGFDAFYGEMWSHLASLHAAKGYSTFQSKATKEERTLHFTALCDTPDEDRGSVNHRERRS